MDSGATGNFILFRTVEKFMIPQQRKVSPIELRVIDGTPISQDGGYIRKETLPTTMRIQQHSEKIQFDIMKISGHNIVLGIPWLKKHNPTVNWERKELGFLRCKCTDVRPLQIQATQSPIDVKICAISTRAIQRIQRRNPEQICSLWMRPVSLCAISEKNDIPKEYEEFKDMFINDTKDLPLPKHEEWDHEIVLEPGKKPTFGPIYSLSEKELAMLRDYLDENLKKGHIRPSTSPAGYPILFVKKKDGTHRLCVDYRQLNNVTVKNRYALPRIDELLDRVQGAKWFTKIDLPGAYSLVRLKEGEEWKTAFRTRYGHYEYLVMPFGLTNAPATFQTLVNNILREYLDIFVIVYLDDILIYSKTREEHVQHVKKVLRALQKRNLPIKPDKCQFHVQTVGFLGFVISPEGIKMEQEKVRAILEWPEPTNVKEVQEFLGFANFYRRFIKKYSDRLVPITKLLQKDVPFKWTQQHSEAMTDIKARFTEEPLLVSPDPEKPYILETDASDYAMGGTLGQKVDGKLHPVAFYSRKFTDAELNYEIHDKELLAIVATLKEWRVYLEGPKYPVTIYSDHKNLTWFTTTKKLNQRQVRWSEALSAYNFKILYRKGSENARADALSRRADYLQNKKDISHAILKYGQEGNMEYNTQVLAATFTIENTVRVQQIKAAYEKDETTRAWLRELPDSLPKDPSFATTPEGLLLFNGLVYVPSGLRADIFSERHEDTTSGHQGIGKTLERITRNYYFPAMRKYVEKRISECTECNRNKASRHAPYGQLKSPKTPSGAWKSIALDFVVKLPLSREPLTGIEYDSILVITCRLTKYGYFIPYLEASTAEDLAYVFLRFIHSNHGLPEEIISDRDKLFTSRFWKSLMDQLGVKHKLSTAYHPQTDGQTERLNQTMEQYLRCFVNYQQNNWVKLLPMAQFAYNSAITETTKVSPFFANYGFEPEAYRQPKEFQALAQQAQMDVAQLKTLHEQLASDIKFLAHRSAIYYNKKRKKGPHLKRGDRVYLLRKNIKTQRPSNKLDHVKLGPFKIKKEVSSVNYELELPQGMKIHPVFHVSLLEPASPSTPLQVKPTLIEPGDQGEYEPEQILDLQDIDGQQHYLVKWKGYDTSDNTWEPIGHLKKCQRLVQQFHQRNPTAQYQDLAVKKAKAPIRQKPKKN